MPNDKKLHILMAASLRLPKMPFWYLTLGQIDSAYCPGLRLIHQKVAQVLDMLS